MDMADAFHTEIYCPPIRDLDATEKVVQELKVFSSQTEVNKVMGMLRGNEVSIGIKKLMMICEMAKQDVDKIEKFVGVMMEQGIVSSSL